MMPIESNAPIVFFDGVCGLCNGFVDFCLKHDKVGRLRFAPLQGQTASQVLSELEVQQLSTIVFVDVDAKKYYKSQAVLKIMGGFGYSWRVLAGISKFAPLPIRNRVYDLVASQRYKIFGKLETCRLPSPEVRSRFLD